MKVKLFVLALVAGLATTAFAGAGVLAADKQQGPMAKYVFRGQLLATPTAAATALSVSVRGGNRIALRKLLGASVNQSFSVGANTVYLRWANGVPTVVQKTSLVAGDRVTVRLRAPRRAPLAEIQAQPAAVVAARAANSPRAQRPLFLFRGTLTAPAAGGSVRVRVTGGNRRALRRLLGQSVDRSFAYDAKTVFLLWRGRTPSVISPSQLKPGAKIVIRIRAARGSTLAQLEATPAKRIAQHERPAK